VPVLYISDDALLNRISAYVKNGGHVVMTFKSGFANENSAVRWVRAPGPLREAAGLSYQEFSNLDGPLALKDDPFHVGSDNQVRYWAEFLMPEHAKTIATYDHSFFGSGRQLRKTITVLALCFTKARIYRTRCRKQC